MNWLKGDLAITSSSGRISPKVYKGGEQRGNWILAVSGNWLANQQGEQQDYLPATAITPYPRAYRSKKRQRN